MKLRENTYRVCMPCKPIYTSLVFLVKSRNFLFMNIKLRSVRIIPVLVKKRQQKRMCSSIGLPREAKSGDDEDTSRQALEVEGCFVNSVVPPKRFTGVLTTP